MLVLLCVVVCVDVACWLVRVCWWFLLLLILLVGCCLCLMPSLFGVGVVVFGVLCVGVVGVRVNVMLLVVALVLVGCCWCLWRWCYCELLV